MTAPIRKSENEGTPRQSLWNYVLTVLVSAALGAGITWLIYISAFEVRVSFDAVVAAG
jgi:hypothetical protein